MGKDSFILEAEGLYKTYRMGLADVKVLRGTELSVKEGEFLSIVGASGSGKSTLLHILGALDKPDKGTVRFEGRDLSEFGAGRMNRFRNKTVGFVFQFYHLLDELNVLENVYLPAMTSSGVFEWFGRRGRAKKRAAELLEAVGLAGRAGHRPFELSGGERQRAAIARALMNEPRLLLADEPTGNLDWTTGIGILGVIEQLNKDGQTVIMVTHNEAAASRAGRVVTLVDGKIVH